MGYEIHLSGQLNGWFWLNSAGARDVGLASLAAPMTLATRRTPWPRGRKANHEPKCAANPNQKCVERNLLRRPPNCLQPIDDENRTPSLEFRGTFTPHDPIHEERIRSVEKNPQTEVHRY